MRYIDRRQIELWQDSWKSRYLEIAMYVFWQSFR